MPSAYIRDAMVREVVRHSRDPQLRIVEVSCGDGLILKQLHELGYRNLTGTHYGGSAEWDYRIAPEDRARFTLVPHADLLARLPFEDAACDVVINTELLEHIENHRHAVGELTRIVKPGGLLVLETPNIMRVPSRLRFLLTGFHKPRTPFPPYGHPLQEHLYYHVFPVHLPVLDFFLYEYGMELERIQWNRWKPAALLLAVLLLPLMALNLGIFLAREKTLARPFKWRLFKLQLHPAILLCNVLILTYRKVRAPL
jgi:SAM-dependent methyltransferase